MAKNVRLTLGLREAEELFNAAQVCIDTQDNKLFTAQERNRQQHVLSKLALAIARAEHA